MLGPRPAKALAAAALLIGGVSLPATWADAVTPAAPSHATSFGQFGGGPGDFNGPEGVAIAPDGSVFVADSFNSRVQKFSRSGTTVTFQQSFGTYGSANGQFDMPTGIAVDVDGWIYVADHDLHRVQVFDSSMAHRYTWGTFGSTPGAFKNPDGIAVSASGTVYVVDSVNNRVQYFTRSGTYLGGWGTAGAGAGQFNIPRQIAIAPDGGVLVTDQNNGRVQMFSATGTHITTLGAGGTGPGQFQFPVGVAVDRNNHVFVVDRYQNNLERWISPPAPATSAYVSSFGSDGSGPGAFDDPHGAALTRDGYLVVADTGNNRIQMFDLCSDRFVDVSGANLFFDPICWMTATGVGRGYSDNTYRPTAAMSRQGMAAHLYRMAGEPTGPFPDPGFTDVPASHPFYTQISWMVLQGIASGYSDGTFQPAAPVTRQSMAAFLHRWVGSPTGSPAPGFSDVSASSPFFDAISWMAFTGITGGYSDGTFGPTLVVTRQAMSAFLARYDGIYHSP